MRILFWNCKELGRRWTVHGMVQLLREQRPNLVFLFETRKLVREIEFLKWKLGYNYGVTTDSIGRSRACLLGNNVSVEILSFSIDYIDEVVDKVSRCTGSYGSHVLNSRAHSWNLLRRLSSISDLPWVVGGDFNEEFIPQCCSFQSTIVDFSSLPNNVGHGADHGMAKGDWSLYYLSIIVVSFANVILETERKINDFMKIEENMWGQCAKSLWQLKGDKNSALFHTCASHHKKNHWIKGIYDFDGEWISDPIVIRSNAYQYFNGVFQSESKSMIDIEGVTSSTSYDSTMFSKTSRHNCLSLKEVLREYGNASGQSDNFNKSSIYYSHNLSVEVKEEMEK
ncbi:hypothetical protein ACFE04_011224 [Oxalis oulophora]